MARVDVLMPQMGESIAEGTLSKWLKKVGDPVKRDEPLFEISTDKVDAGIAAPTLSVELASTVPHRHTVPVRTDVAVLGAATPDARRIRATAALAWAAAGAPAP